ncbi:MAG: hypothetical protein AAFZ91_01070 [Pseudomonadota bacterium]
MSFQKALIGALLFFVSACATVTPEPCTAEWVDWKTDSILDEFAQSNRGELRRLSNFSEDLQANATSPLTAFRLPGMIEDFQTLAADFEGRVLPEVNAALEQCGSAETLIPLFTQLLRREGFSEEVLEWTVFLGAISGQV